MPENEKKPKSHYIDKIRKLFALSESPVDAEAIAALTKARELMVKYKITKEDIADTDNSDITKAYMDNIQFHARKDIWIRISYHKPRSNQLSTRKCFTNWNGKEKYCCYPRVKPNCLLINSGR